MFYVSKSGSDVTGTGSESNPFSTIQKAITSAAQLPSTSNLYEIPMININSGLYEESLTITRSVNIQGPEFLLNNNAGYTKNHSVVIGNNTNLIFLSTPTQSTSPSVKFENVDIRCPITNMESTVNNYTTTINYCNIEQQSNRPTISIVGPGNLFLSNCNLDGIVSSNISLYVFSSNITTNIEECRIQGTTSTNSLIYNNGVINMFNTIVYMNVKPLSGLTNVPLILQDSRSGSGLNFNNSQFYLSYPDAKTTGANIITVPITTTINGVGITLDQCYFGITNGISTNYIYENQNPAVNRVINLNLRRQNSMALGNNGTFNPVNTNITNNFIITPLNRFRGDIDLNFNNLLNCSTISSSGNLTVSRTTGNIIFQNLPTTSVGLPSGSLWNDSGVLSIVP